MQMDNFQHMYILQLLGDAQKSDYVELTAWLILSWRSHKSNVTIQKLILWQMPVHVNLK